MINIFVYRKSSVAFYEALVSYTIKPLMGFLSELQQRATRVFINAPVKNNDLPRCEKE